MVALKNFLEKETAFFDLPLRLSSRILILLAVASLGFVFLFPLWSMTFYSNQYTDGLQLYIYGYQLEGAKTHDRDDLSEINTLNHYIGMKPLRGSDFTEFTWIPFVVGGLGLLSLRAVIVGKMANVVDAFVLYIYFGLFSLWSFYHRLYLYGHELSPEAPIKVNGFTPPLLGENVIANFTIESIPDIGAYALCAFGLFLAVAIFLSRRRTA